MSRCSRNALAYDAAGRNDNILSNLHSTQDDRSCADLSAIADDDRAVGKLNLGWVSYREDALDLRVSLCSAQRMCVIVENIHVGTNYDAVSDSDRGSGPYPGAHINIAIASDLNVATMCKNKKLTGNKRI